MMEEIRAAIEAGEYQAYKEEKNRRYDIRGQIDTFPNVYRKFT